MNVNKAAAYLTHSQGGQVADIAEGIRYVDNEETIRRAQEMILDRLEYLMVEKGFASYNRGASLNFLNTWKRYTGDPNALKEAAQAAKEGSDEFLENIANEAKLSIETLRTINKERPNYLRPMRMAYEFSDGDINTIAKLNNFVDQSLGAIQKGVYDLSLIHISEPTRRS